MNHTNRWKTFSVAAVYISTAFLQINGLNACGAPPEDDASHSNTHRTREEVREMKETVAGQELRYLLQTPVGHRPESGWPLLLFLHGYGECGNDIEKVRKHGPPKLIGSADFLAECVIVSPQCPDDSWWRVDTLKALVEEVTRERSDIDCQRLYVTGLSMGGYGIWSFISRYPDYFAAAIPICGGGDPFRLPANRPPEKIGIRNEFDPEGLKRASNLPVWAFHGTDDSSVPIVETKMLVDVLKGAGAEQVRFTAIEGAGHVEAWEQAYEDPEVWRWLFSQRKP
jgi:predicted peptidase